MGTDANLLTYATYQSLQGDKEQWPNEVHTASANRLDTALTIQTEYSRLSRLYRTEPLLTIQWFITKLSNLYDVQELEGTL